MKEEPKKEEVEDESPNKKKKRVLKRLGTGKIDLEEKIMSEHEEMRMIKK